MAIIIITSKGNEQEWQEALLRLNPEIEVRVYPNNKDDDEVSFALAWDPPMGVFNRYKNLKCIASTGAGVDHIIKDPAIDKSVKMTRVVDQRLAKDMSSYLIAQVMVHLRGLFQYKEQQQRILWNRQPYEVPETTGIGIMGLGELGRAAAAKFLDLGFKVQGWSKSEKSIHNVEQFVGDDQLSAFLKKTNILICLLPLTDETKGILKASLFKKLPQGAYIINVARGEHLVEEDLINAVNSGHLSGACLDVFKEEPLPMNHPFWKNEKIIITPHVASITSILDVAPQIIENYRRITMNQSLINQVKREKGY